MLLNSPSGNILQNNRSATRHWLYLCRNISSLQLNFLVLNPTQNRTVSPKSLLSLVYSPVSSPQLSIINYLMGVRRVTSTIIKMSCKLSILHYQSSIATNPTLGTSYKIFGVSLGTGCTCAVVYLACS